MRWLLRPKSRNLQRHYWLYIAYEDTTADHETPVEVDFNGSVLRPVYIGIEQAPIGSRLTDHYRNALADVKNQWADPFTAGNGPKQSPSAPALVVRFIYLGYLTQTQANQLHEVPLIEGTPGLSNIAHNLGSDPKTIGELIDSVGRPEVEPTEPFRRRFAQARYKLVQYSVRVAFWWFPLSVVAIGLLAEYPPESGTLTRLLGSAVAFINQLLELI